MRVLNTDSESNGEADIHTYIHIPMPTIFNLPPSTLGSAVLLLPPPTIATTAFALLFSYTYRQKKTEEQRQRRKRQENIGRHRRTNRSR